ncbi:hypothetical protein [Modestobacter sp. SSW1-42]|uniref:hypothetical protein n=1 Tax=Modestobacter sp. SSW1-42 TaxID=596372 RepID=UPI003987B828
MGAVQTVGEGVDPQLVGQRVGALTKTGGWTSHAVLDAADVVPVPDGLDPAEVEAFVINDITA